MAYDFAHGVADARASRMPADIRTSCKQTFVPFLPAFSIVRHLHSSVRPHQGNAREEYACQSLLTLGAAKMWRLVGMMAVLPSTIECGQRNGGGETGGEALNPAIFRHESAKDGTRPH